MSEARINKAGRQQLEDNRAAIEKLSLQQDELDKVGLGDADLKRSIARSKARVDVLLGLDAV